MSLYQQEIGLGVNGNVAGRQQDSVINQNVEYLQHRLEELGNHNNELQVQVNTVVVTIATSSMLS